jgi:hypothetical protein
MSKPIVLTVSQWQQLRERIKSDYGVNTLLVRDRMKKKLGFLDRDHLWWSEQSGYQNRVCLDFYDESKRTMFLLKYSEYIKISKTEHMY